MKIKFILLFVFGTPLLSSCNNSSQFAYSETSGKVSNKAAYVLSAYRGKFTDTDNGESFEFKDDGTVIRKEFRQVGGGADSQVPYETVCSYTLAGGLIGVINRDAAELSQYLDFAPEIFVVQYDDFQLSNEQINSTSNPDCLKFSDEMKEQINQRGSLQYSYYAEFLSGSSFRIQTAGGGDYQEGGPRTPSTLDEVYTK